MKKKYKYIIAALILILLLTNPSMQKFQDFKGQKNIVNGELKRNFNFLLFSIYSDNSELKYDKDYSSRYEEYSKYRIHKYYVGVLMNFVKVTETEERTFDF
jgi:hypothetical protein